MPLLAEALGIADTVRPMDHTHEFSPAEGSVVEAGSDMFAVPFSSEAGEPQVSSASCGAAETTQSTNTVWDLRPGSWVKLTGLSARQRSQISRACTQRPCAVETANASFRTFIKLAHARFTSRQVGPTRVNSAKSSVRTSQAIGGSDSPTVNIRASPVRA